MKERRILKVILFIGLWMGINFQSVFGQTILVQTEDKSPLEGATFETDLGVFLGLTDGLGHFTLPSQVHDSSIIVIRYLGYDQVQRSAFKLRKNTTVTMVASSQIMDEIIIVGRTDELLGDLPYQTDIVSSDEIRFSQPQNTADAIALSGNAFIQKSQMGGGSPILRGFEANKVLLVVDGVRMNNAIYRSGHLQNSITVDEQSLERIEVSYGASSLIYGSDALGGVVHLRTRQSAFQPEDAGKKLKIGGNYLFQWNSASNGRTGHFGLDIQGRKVTSYTSISASAFGDLVSGDNRNKNYPDFGYRYTYVNPGFDNPNERDKIVDNPNPNKQIYSGYNQFDLLQKFRFRISEKWDATLNFQYSTSSDIPRYDQLTEVEEDGSPTFSEWNYGPQDRLLASFKMEYKDPTFFSDHINLIIAGQRIEEDRITRNYLSDSRISQLETVDILSLNLDAWKNLDQAKKHQLQYGFEAHFNQVRSEAFSENIDDGTKTYDVLTRYPSDGSKYNSFGLFALWRYKSVSSKLETQVGIRWSHFSSYVKYSTEDIFDWPDYFYQGISQNNNAFTIAGGLVFRPSESWEIKSNIGNAFRAPNIDDFAKVRVKGENMTIPNTDLSPEKTINFDLGIKKDLFGTAMNKPLVSIELSGFYTLIEDAIVQRNSALPNGDTIYISQGKPYRVQANVNAESGWIAGLSTGLQIQINRTLVLSGTYNFTKGKSKEDDKVSPLAHIPPQFGVVKLAFKKDKWNVEGGMFYNGWKKIEDYAPDSSDNLEYATVDGTPSWQSYYLRASYQVLPALTVRIGVENIGDLHYRPFSSGISAIGRNYQFGLSGSF